MTRPTATVAAFSTFVLLFLVAALAGCGGPSTITTHGTIQDCTGALSDGDQVTVADPAGKILGSGTLTEDHSKAAQADESTYNSLQGMLSQFDDTSSGMTVYDFTVSGVQDGEARYGVSAGSKNTVWFTPAELKHGPGLSLGCNS